ncbi:MAG: hypothetical protein F4W95_12445 [Chloroflexi bacterium]|nr:hypothetical protein [Chloroflexota bacterium]MYD49276.1 hypothetical protein [Chloroflexota bacterium]
MNQRTASHPFPHPGGCGVKIACVLVTHLRAKVEMRRQPHLKGRPVVIIDRSLGRPLVIDHFPAASNVSAGMTLEQALSRQTDGDVLEADEGAYRREFQRMLLSLQRVSDRVEGAEMGTAYVRLDGLESMYSGEARLVTTLLNATPQYLAPRVGVGNAKFPAYVAARTSHTLGSVRVPPEAAHFLAPHSVDLLPLPPAVKEEMRCFGLHTLGDVAVMKPEALINRFGPEGQRAWELAQGIDGFPWFPSSTRSPSWNTLPCPLPRRLWNSCWRRWTPCCDGPTPNPECGAGTPGEWRWSVPSTESRPGRKTSTSGGLWETGNGPPASSGVNWKVTIPGLR